MAQSTTGTFTETGQSAIVTARAGTIIHMDFAGTATVQIQVRNQTNGAWMTVETATADYYKRWDAAGATIRLNCSAHTDNVVYWVG